MGQGGDEAHAQANLRQEEVAGSQIAPHPEGRAAVEDRGLQGAPDPADALRHPILELRAGFFARHGRDESGAIAETGKAQAQTRIARDTVRIEAADLAQERQAIMAGGTGEQQRAPNLASLGNSNLNSKAFSRAAWRVSQFSLRL